MTAISARKPVVLDPHVRCLVDDLLTRSALLIDRNDLEGWLDCFEAESRYVVMPRDNRDRGFPAALIHCDSKARLRDRIVCLRHANKFNPHYERHIVSAGHVHSVVEGVATVESSFMVVQTTLSGVSTLFCAGGYEDRIRITGAVATFAERIAVVDSFSVPTLLATPV
jgi:anthranilate 1,2-dioxygenase small subunit